MRRFARPLVLMLGLIALVALGLTVASGPAGQSRISSSRAQVAAADDHAAFVAIVDARVSARLGNLVGLLAVVVIAAAGWASGRSLLTLESATAHGALRRWRARLVGAPPALR